MKHSSKLFFKAIILEFLESKDFKVDIGFSHYICDKENIRVKIGYNRVHIYDMSQKYDLYKLITSVRYNETKSLDKVRDTIEILLKNYLSECQKKDTIDMVRLFFPGNSLGLDFKIIYIGPKKDNFSLSDLKLSVESK